MKFLSICLTGFLLLGCVPSPGQVPATTEPQTLTPTGSTPGTPFPLEDPVLVGAGDIARCTSTSDEATANLLDSIPGTVYTTGDNAYEDGTVAEFANCYDPSWGRHKARTYPSVGNHDYLTKGAVGYFDYFGLAAGDPDKGYYSYELGTWHIIVLNSQCGQVGGCNAGSPQYTWLQQDLQTHENLCTLAYYHIPIFSSGGRTNNNMKQIYALLYDRNVEVILNGHDHIYERFAPQDPNGLADPSRGIREFIVGTGGANHTSITTIQPNSEVRNADTFGVLKLTLHPDSYDWQFIPVAGKTFSDSGTTICH
jgi:hypothetical protein